MLQEANISLDRNEIESIKQKHLRQWVQSHSELNQLNHVNKVEYELVKSEIFPKEFIPYCVDQYSRGSCLKLYEVNKNSYDFNLLNMRIQLLYETINSFKQEIQRQRLIHMFNLDEISNLVAFINEFQQSSTQSQYLSYVEQGMALDRVDLWRFNHYQQNPKIPYEQRSLLFNDYLLILRVIVQLTKSAQFQNFSLDTKAILMFQYQTIDQAKLKYGIKINCKRIFDMLVHNKQTRKEEIDLLHNVKKILKKFLGISQDKSERSELDQYHHKKIQQLTSIHDIIKLNYQDFYFVKKKIDNPNKNQSDHSKEQHLQKLKQQILYFEDLAKNQLKSFKLENPKPKINLTTTQEPNKNYLNIIEKYILSNITESQRQNILNPPQKKPTPQPNTVKKPEKKPSTSTIKKQSKLQSKEVSKVEKKEQPLSMNTPNQTKKQVIIQTTFLSSASDIKFRPEKLIQLIQDKEKILYILNTKNKNINEQNIITCYINCKLQKQSINLLGAYSSDSSKKSFVYSSKTQKFYKLMDKNYAVGYGSDIFFSIGKLDIIIPCFGTDIVDGREFMKCVSYFPVSYSGKGTQFDGIEKVQDDQVTQPSSDNQFSQLGIGKEFLLEDVDIYEIKFKAQ